MRNSEPRTQLVICDPEILSGTPVFAGTRVPVETLVDYLGDGDTLDSFLDYFPTVSRDPAKAVLNTVIQMLISQAEPAKEA
jgi:uncharacterized protein (DUF433 family)